MSHYQVSQNQSLNEGAYFANVCARNLMSECITTLSHGLRDEQLDTALERAQELLEEARQARGAASTLSRLHLTAQVQGSVLIEARNAEPEPES